jgi:hypothetical protein
MLYQHMMSHNLVAKLKDQKVPMQIYRLTEARTIFSVKDLESKDKSTVIITQQNDVDTEDGQVYDTISCTCRYHWSF